MIDKTKTRLKMLPVCEYCGHVFYDGVSIYPIRYEFTKKDVLIQRTEISPCQCPKCKRIIDAIDYRDLEDYVVYTGKPRIAD